MTRTAAELIASINGSCRHAITAGINGNLPPHWDAYGLHAIVQPALDPTHVIAFAMATKKDPHGYPVLTDANPGAKVEVEAATADLLKLADDLAEQLREAIARRQPKPDRLQVRIALAEGAILPERKTSGASGYDLCALAGIQIQPGRVVVVETGVSLEMPEGMEAQVRPRSGLAKAGVWVHLATIDQDYRGKIAVMMINLRPDAFSVAAGDRVAQLVFARVDHPELQVVDASTMTATGRGAMGFGSTGR